MALFKFTKNILSNMPIDIYNNGNMRRDFTYVDDLVKAIFLLISRKPEQVNKRNDIIKNDSLSRIAPFRVVNIGNSNPVNLDFIKELENILGRSKEKFFRYARRNIQTTHSNIKLLKDLTGFEPTIHIHEGISQFVKWYKSYY